MLICTFLFAGAHIRAALTDPQIEQEESTPISPSKSPDQGDDVSPSKDPVIGSSKDNGFSEESALPSEPKEESPWLLVSGEDGGTAYQDSLIFLGDSTTYGLLDRGILSDGKASKQVWFGISGHTITFKFHDTAKITDTYGETDLTKGYTIAEMAGNKKPPVLVITLGVTGGVSYFSNNMDEALFTTLYEKLINDILESSPDTKIICNSIYPVCKVVDSTVDADITNENISKANGWIKNVVKSNYESGKDVYYLDSYSQLIGEDGYLPATYTNGDGLHLSDSALKAVLELIRTHRIP